ncbi:ATP-binding protein [Verrucomicrobium sp. BvORR034]|uniref:nSTAND1 domain-containing NTPase n=1 Tax=Verrucomicrobium sp. BvORR034 TaxID=1396418 RepID=UPI000678D519|nr:ATP-binding protein [Verrucomicrobium sp. BvORR034]
MQPETDLASCGLRNPFPGPRPLPCDGLPIGGRREATQRLAGFIHAFRHALLHGPSGAGKTSLVNAGLIPQLDSVYHPIFRLEAMLPTQAGLEASGKGTGANSGHMDKVQLVKPNCLPSDERWEAVSPVCVALALGPWFDGMEGGEVARFLGWFACHRLRECGNAAGEPGGKTTQATLPVTPDKKRHPLLIFDGFELVYKRNVDELSALFRMFDRIFRASISEADFVGEDGWNNLRAEGGQLRSLFVVRSSYMGHLEPWRRWIPGEFSASVELQRMDRKQAEDAIRTRNNDAPAGGQAEVGAKAEGSADTDRGGEAHEIELGQAGGEGVKNVGFLSDQDIDNVITHLTLANEAAKSGPLASSVLEDSQIPDSSDSDQMIEPQHLSILCSNLWEMRRRGNKSDVTREQFRMWLNGFMDDCLQEAVAKIAQSDQRLERGIRLWMESSLILPASRSGLRHDVNEGSGSLVDLGHVGDAEWLGCLGKLAEPLSLQGVLVLHELERKNVLARLMVGNRVRWRLSHGRLIVALQEANDRYFRAHSGWRKGHVWPGLREYAIGGGNRRGIGLMLCMRFLLNWVWQTGAALLPVEKKYKRVATIRALLEVVLPLGVAFGLALISLLIWNQAKELNKTNNELNKTNQDLGEAKRRVGAVVSKANQTIALANLISARSWHNLNRSSNAVITATARVRQSAASPLFERFEASMLYNEVFQSPKEFQQISESEAAVGENDGNDWLKQVMLEVPRSPNKGIDPNWKLAREDIDFNTRLQTAGLRNLKAKVEPLRNAVGVCWSLNSRGDLVTYNPRTQIVDLYPASGNKRSLKLEAHGLPLSAPDSTALSPDGGKLLLVWLYQDRCTRLLWKDLTADPADRPAVAELNPGQMSFLNQRFRGVAFIDPQRALLVGEEMIVETDFSQPKNSKLVVKFHSYGNDESDPHGIIKSCDDDPTVKARGIRLFSPVQSEPTHSTPSRFTFSLLLHRQFDPNPVKPQEFFLVEVTQNGDRWSVRDCPFPSAAFEPLDLLSYQKDGKILHAVLGLETAQGTESYPCLHTCEMLIGSNAQYTVTPSFPPVAFAGSKYWMPTLLHASGRYVGVRWPVGKIDFGDVSLMPVWKAESLQATCRQWCPSSVFTLAADASIAESEAGTFYLGSPTSGLYKYELKQAMSDYAVVRVQWKPVETAFTAPGKQVLKPIFALSSDAAWAAVAVPKLANEEPYGMRHAVYVGDSLTTHGPPEKFETDVCLHSLSFDPTGKWLVAGGDNGKIRIYKRIGKAWSSAAKDEVRFRVSNTMTTKIVSLSVEAINEEVLRVMCQTSVGAIYACELNTKTAAFSATKVPVAESAAEETISANPQRSERFSSISRLSAERWLVLRADGIYDVASESGEKGWRVRRLSSLSSQTITTLAVSKDGKMLATGSERGDVNVFRMGDVQAGELTLDHVGGMSQRQPIRNLLFISTDPCRLASFDGRDARVWSEALQKVTMESDYPLLYHPPRMLSQLRDIEAPEVKAVAYSEAGEVIAVVVRTLDRELKREAVLVRAPAKWPVVPLEEITTREGANAQ